MFSSVDRMALIFSLSLVLLAAIWERAYRNARAARKYSAGKESTRRNPGFKVMGKVIFVVGTAVTFASLWTDSPWLLKLHSQESLKVAGLLILCAAVLLQNRALHFLSANYSPCFDSYRPIEIVKQGPYKYIRHPLYSANILNAIGYALISGSLWVLLIGLYGIYEILSALNDEEKFLRHEFSDYADYARATRRLFPFLY